MVQGFMQPLLAWHCAGGSGKEVTKRPEEAGSLREGILGDVTADAMAPEPQRSECLGSWGQRARRIWEAPRAAEGTLNLELHRFLRRLGYAQLINRAGTQGSSRTGLGTHSLTHLPKCFVLTTDLAAPESLLLDVSGKL